MIFIKAHRATETFKGQWFLYVRHRQMVGTFALYLVILYNYLLLNIR